MSRTTVDSVFSDRWIIEHRFQLAQNRKIRPFILSVTHGGRATQLVQEAGGQAGDDEVVLREIEIYGR